MARCAAQATTISIGQSGESNSRTCLRAGRAVEQLSAPGPPPLIDPHATSHPVLLVTRCPVGYASERPPSIATPERTRYLPLSTMVPVRAHCTTDVVGFPPRNVLTMRGGLPGLQVDRRTVVLGDARLACHRGVVSGMNNRGVRQQESDDYSKNEGPGPGPESNAEERGAKRHADHRTGDAGVIPGMPKLPGPPCGSTLTRLFPWQSPSVTLPDT